MDFPNINICQCISQWAICITLQYYFRQASSFHSRIRILCERRERDGWHIYSTWLWSCWCYW